MKEKNLFPLGFRLLADVSTTPLLSLSIVTSDRHHKIGNEVNVLFRNSWLLTFKTMNPTAVTELNNLKYFYSY